MKKKKLYTAVKFIVVSLIAISMLFSLALPALF